MVLYTTHDYSAAKGAPAVVPIDDDVTYFISCLFILLTPTTVARVKRLATSVCLFVHTIETKQLN